MPKPYQVLEADFVVNTPLFLGGADNSQTAELRLSSIKGALRFWWRALEYSKCTGATERQRIDELRKREAEIFGSTANQSTIHLSLGDKKDGEFHQQSTVFHKFKEHLGLPYIGYGLMQAFDKKIKDTDVIEIHAGTLWRPCRTGTSFTLRALSRNPIPDSFIRAVKIFGMLGGLGSRARKGFGSVTLLTLRTGENKEWNRPDNLEDLGTEIIAAIGPGLTLSRCPSISAFSAETVVEQLNKGNNALDLMADYGEKMLRFRSHGVGGTIHDGTRGIAKNLHFTSEKRFPCDHDWYKDPTNWAINCSSSHPHPRRIVFGLPHNYAQSPRFHITPENFERRASPLLFHVHQFSNSSYGGIALVLTSEFLPNNEKLSLGGKPKVDPQPEYALFGEFFDAETRGQQDAAKNGLEYFRDRKSIWPPQDTSSDGGAS